MKSLFHHYRGYLYSYLFVSLFLVTQINAQNETISSGSFIINMGNTNTVSINDDVKPYGLIYDLMKNYNVPIKWVITPGKVKDGIDFIHNGIQYKGGTFIIPAAFRNASVDARITYWVGQGVVGATSVSAFDVYVYKTLVSVPRWTLDAANGSIAQAYLTAAGITLAAFPGAYNWKSPQTLDCCDDFFVMPHANPTWSTHSRLYSWNKDCLGSIWAACHAVSALENSINPSNSAEQMNFLSTRSATFTPSVYPNNSLTLWGSHSGGSIPYTHRLFDDPVAQYIGVTDLSQLNGSEQIYLPKQSGPNGPTRWRPGVNIIAYDPTQSDVSSPDLANGNVAAVMVYGRGFDDPTRGFVMYEAGHSHMKGTTSDGPALRAFLNFSFFQVQPKAPQLGSIGGLVNGQNVTQASPLSLSISASSPLVGVTFSYQWVSSCGGVFSNPTGSSTTYTPPSVGSNTNCTVTCIVSDNCGRKSFQSETVTVVPPPRPPVANADAQTVDPGCGSATITKNVLANDTDPDGDPITLTLVNGNAGSFTTANGGTVSFNAAGTITYTTAEGFYGNETLTYTVCDNTSPTPLCTNGTYIITVGNLANVPPATDDAFTIAEDAIGTFNVLANDLPVTNGPYTVYAITSGPSNGKAVINTDNTITYVPNPDFAGTDIIRYRIVNALGYSKSAQVTVTVTDDACNGGTYQSAAGTSNTVIYNSSVADMSIRYQAPVNLDNCGIRTSLEVTGNSGVQPRRALLHFNLSTLPGGITITNADLRLRRSGGNNTSQTIDVYRMTTDWNEGTLNNTPNTLISDGSTWYGPTFSTKWNTIGGDFSTANGASLTGLTSNNTIYTWNVTTITQGWYNSTFSNYGFIVKDPTEGNSNDKIFDSRENGTPANSPTLRVTYNPGNVTVDIVADRDNWIYESTAQKIWEGNTTTFQVNAQGPGNAEARLLVKFDVKPADIPTGSTITSATVKLTRTGGDNTAQDIGAYQATSSWNEGLGTNTNNTAALDGATWFNRNFSKLWTTNGGDFTLTGGAVTNVSSATGGTAGTADYNWNVLSIVQNWVKTSPDPNYGFLIKAVNENVNLQKIFGTRENGTAGNRPTLIVNYTTPPTCASIPARAPLGNQDTASTLSTTPVTFNVLINDYLFSQPAIALTISTAPIAAQGTVSANLATGEVTFTPNPTFVGVASFRYTVTTANGTDIVRVYVKVNDAPVVANDDNPAGQNSGTVQTITVLTNDNDPEGAALTVTILTQPVHGTATVNGSNQVVYTPNTGYTGTDALTYQVCEPAPICGDPVCDDATVNITVLNQPPVGTPDSKTILPCLANTIDLLSNDTDPEGHKLTISSLSVLSNPSAGTLVNNNDGTVTFTPAPGYSGTVTFTYSLTDDGIPPMSSTTPVLVTIIVFNPPNTAPVAGNDAESTNMEQVLYASILDNDSDPESQNLTLPVITVAPLHGSATVLLNGLIEYTPNPGFAGTDILTYQICDQVINQATCTTASGLCATATLTITVEATNSVVAVNDENSTWVNTVVSGTTLTNDVDPQGDLPLVFGGFMIGGTAYTSGTYTISGVDASDTPVANAGTITINTNGTYTYTPANNFTGVVNVPYILNDSNPNIASDTANLRITVNPLPDVTNSVIANNDEISTLPNTTVSSTLFTNDRDPQANSFTVTSYQYDTNGDGTPDGTGTIGSPVSVGGVTTAGTSLANAGSLTLNADGTYTFTPAADFSGTVIVPYTITDALGATSTALLHIDVLADSNGPANDQPQPGDDFVYTGHNTLVNASFISNDSDPNANPVSLNGVTINTGGPATTIGSPVATVQGGTVQFYADGTYSYTPPVGFTGPDRVIYRVCDITAVNPQPLCADATIHMLVGPALTTLPSTGLKATATLLGEITTIKWETLSEQNTDYFTVERSTDNNSFVPVGNPVNAAGNSTTKQQYQRTDNISSLLQQTVLYYRVRLTDIDGKIKYSNVTVVRMGKTFGITAWPNPFKSSITVNVSTSQPSTLLIQLTDIAGRQIRTSEQQVARGISQVVVNNLDQLVNGIYLLDITDKNSGSRTVYKLYKEQ